MEYNDVLNAMNEQKLNYEQVLNENEALQQKIKIIKNKLFTRTKTITDHGTANPFHLITKVEVDKDILEQMLREKFGNKIPDNMEIRFVIK